MFYISAENKILIHHSTFKNNSIFAKEIEDNIYTYEDDSFESEEDIINDVKGAFFRVDNYYDREDYENIDMLDK